MSEDKSFYEDEEINNFCSELLEAIREMKSDEQSIVTVVEVTSLSDDVDKHKDPEN